MIKKLLMLALTSGLAAKALQMWIERESSRQTRGLDRADVQRWEDEGGNLPPGGSPPARRTAKAADAGTPRPRGRRAATSTSAT